MTGVLYRGLSRLIDLEQVPIKPALVDKARPKDALKKCLKRALPICFSAISCAGHVMEDGWKDVFSWKGMPQTIFNAGLTAFSGRPFSCAGHVLDLLTSKSTVLGKGGWL